MQNLPIKPITTQPTLPQGGLQLKPSLPALDITVPAGLPNVQQPTIIVQGQLPNSVWETQQPPLEIQPNMPAKLTQKSLQDLLKQNSPEAMETQKRQAFVEEAKKAYEQAFKDFEEVISKGVDHESKTIRNSDDVYYHKPELDKTVETIKDKAGKEIYTITSDQQGNKTYKFHKDGTLYVFREHNGKLKSIEQIKKDEKGTIINQHTFEDIDDDLNFHSLRGTSGIGCYGKFSIDK